MNAVREWSSYQRAVFDAVERGAGNLVVEALAGCIAGDAMIGCNRAGKGFRMPLVDVVARFNGGLAGSRRWDRAIPTYVRAPQSDGTVRLARLEAARASGERPVLALALAGRTLLATPDHRFLTPTGWQRLDALAAGAVVLVEADTLGPGQGRTAKRNYLKRHVPHHPHAVNSGAGTLTVPTHRLNVEASINDIDMEAFIWRLQSSADGLVFLAPGLVVHHRDHHHWNNGLDNLRVVTEAEHRQLHSDDNECNVQTRLVEARVKAVRDDGQTIATFDLTVPGVDAFMANGIAVHNSGKTTTILEAVRRIPHGQRVLLCAFNTRIKDELQKRAPAGVEVLTLHGLGYRAVRGAWGRHVRPDDQRERKLLEDVAPWARGECRSAILRLVGLAKNTLADGHEQVEALAFQAGVAFHVEPDQLSDVVDAALSVMARSARRGPEISFDDMVWLPALNRWRTGAFDVVLVDETQDLCAAQIRLVLAAVQPGGRVIAVGDRFQAIYGFRGADERAIPRLIDELSATTLPLSICYRCPRLVVEQARAVVPAIEAAPAALDGEVAVVHKDAAEKAEPGDVILSRTNAPLVPLCLRFLKRGVPAAVAGRDVAKRVRALIDQAAEAAGADGRVEPVLEWIAAWAEQQVERLVRRGLEEKIDEVRDLEATVVALLEDAADLDAARARIERVFSDAANGGVRVLLSTVHKAKGLEWPTVWVLADTFKRGRNQEEDNIFYVAITRAQWRLVLVSSTVASV